MIHNRFESTPILKPARTIIPEWVFSNLNLSISVDMRFFKRAQKLLKMFLSELLRWKIEDENGNRFKLVDCSLAVSDHEDQPYLSNLLLRHGKIRRVVPWNDVQGFDRKTCRLTFASSDHQLATDELPPRDVSLVDDVLDAQILDLEKRRATRANDVVLREEGNKIRVFGVDFGVRAVLRRLTRGLWNKVERDDWLEWRYAEFLRGDPLAWGRGERYLGRVGHLAAGELAFLCETIPYPHAAELLTLLTAPQAAETLQILSPQRQLQILEELPKDRAHQILAEMSPELAADLLAGLDLAEVREHLESLPPKRRGPILELLAYPADSAGGIMTNDILVLTERMTVADARQELVRRAPKFAFYGYVVKAGPPGGACRRAGQLLGTLALRQLTTAESESPIGEIINTYINMVEVTTPAVTAAHTVLRSHMAALPVVNGEGLLLGVITSDTALAQVLPQSMKDQLPRIFT